MIKTLLLLNISFLKPKMEEIKDICGFDNLTCAIILICVELIQNSINAMTSNILDGRIIMTFSPHSENINKFLICIADTGCGIPHELLILQNESFLKIFRSGLYRSVVYSSTMTGESIRFRQRMHY